MLPVRQDYYVYLTSIFEKCTSYVATDIIQKNGIENTKKLLGIDPYIEALVKLFNKHFLSETQITVKELDEEMSFSRELTIKEEVFCKKNENDPLYFNRVLDMMIEYHDNFIRKHKYTGSSKYAHYFKLDKEFLDLTYEEFLFELSIVNYLMKRFGAVLWLSLNKFTSYGSLVEPADKMIKAYKELKIAKPAVSKHNQEHYDKFVQYDVDKGFGCWYVSEVDMEKYDSDTYIGKEEFGGYKKGYMSYVFNDEDCKLKTIHFKGDILFLEECFENAAELENIICEGEVLQVKCGPFDKSLKVQTVLDGVVYVKVNDNPYYICLKYIGGKQNVQLHPDCVIVAERAFQHSEITGIHFNNVKYIGDYAVDNCEYLKALIMSDSTISLGESSLAGSCKNLSMIVLSNSLKRISCEITSNNDALVNITLPNKLEYISTLAFSYCSRLKDIRFPETCKDYGWFVVSNCPNVKKVYVPKGSNHSNLVFGETEVIEY